MRPDHRSFLLLLLFVAAGCLAAGPGRAQPARTLTADEAVRLGLAHNATLRAAAADADAAQAAYRQVRAGRLPSFTTQSSYTRLSDNIPEIGFEGDFLPGLDTTFTLAPVVLNRYYAEVAVEQPLFTGLRLHNRIRAARRQAEAAAHGVRQEEADVAFAIRQAYWRLYQALAVRAATDAALAQVEAHLQDVERRRAAGAALTSDVLAARTRRSEVRLEGVEAENAVRVARLELNRLTGLPLDASTRPADAEPTGDVAREPLPGDVDALVARALEDRPGLDALGAQVASREAEVDAAQGAWLPQVALTGRYVYARPNQYFFTEQDAFHGTWEAGVRLRWDLWDGGARLAETRQARARLESARARLGAAREAAAVEVMRQHLEAQRAAEAVAVAAENVEQARETLRMVRQQYAEGAALSARVLDAEQAYRAAQTRRARAAADYAIARAALLHALGQVQ